MATATRAEHVTLGGLLMATRAINCHDWRDLKSNGPMRGADLVIPGAAGELARTRAKGAVRALLRVRINGRFDHDTDAATADARAGAYAAWGLVLAKAEVTTTQTLTLTYPTSQTASGPCQVLEASVVDEPVPWIWECVLDVKLPDGTLL